MKSDGHVLQGYIVGERDGRPESVPGHVRGQVFLYAAEIGDFLEVAVHFLVALTILNSGVIPSLPSLPARPSTPSFPGSPLLLSLIHILVHFSVAAFSNFPHSHILLLF